MPDIARYALLQHIGVGALHHDDERRVHGLEVGVDTFDSSMAGIGGCPFAPGATGNVVTEDLVFMFEAMGISTGVDLPRLLAARDILASSLPGEELYGYVPAAGLPLGFRPT